MSHVQENGRDARADEAHVGRHGDGDSVAARAAGALQGGNHQVQRLREGAAEEELAPFGRAVSALREFQHGRGEDHDDGTGGARFLVEEWWGWWG